MDQRRKNEGVDKMVEIVEKLRRQNLWRQQELSRQRRRCAKLQFGGRNSRILQRDTPEAKEDLWQL